MKTEKTDKYSMDSSKHLLHALILLEELNLHCAETADADAGVIARKLHEHITYAFCAKSGYTYQRP